MRGHFLPRGQYTPECRKGLGEPEPFGFGLLMLRLASIRLMLRKLCNPT